MASRYAKVVVALMVGCILASVAMAADPKPKAKAKVKKPRKPANAAWMVTKMPKDKVICFAMWTLHKDILKMTAQLYELDADAPRTVRLEVRKGDAWTQVATAKVVEKGWTATFRVEKWDSTRDWPYRVAHGETAFYTGMIRKDPVDKKTIVVAAFTGNSNRNREARPDLIANIKKQDPDLLFFSGDQVYDHGKHFPAWLLFGRQFGEIIKDRPTIAIPDDHDVGNGNLWGAAGKVGPGGYRDAEFIKEVERAQTSNLPDPFDPTPIERGIGVYYTGLTWGRISFGIVEDRKFKSQTSILKDIDRTGLKFVRADHIQKFDVDPKVVDIPQARLLGERQLKFLRHWSADWSGADMKAVLSQTVFVGAAHLHGNKNGRLLADLDCNGWPQTGRNNALREIRKSFALMIGGDQHLATVIHQGVETWDDSGYSFCVPSIQNYYNRWWMPLAPGANRPEGPLQHTGQFKDGFGNRLTMLAYANPDPDRPKYGQWGARADGHGIIRFNKSARTITMECWPRGTDVNNPKHKQFVGWPIMIRQEDNYSRKAVAYLPTLQITGQTNPVVQVIDEGDGSVVYTLRIKGATFRPKVFGKGKYTVKIGEGKSAKTLKGVQAVGADSDATVKVAL